MDEAYIDDDDTKTGHCVEAKTGHRGEAKTGRVARQPEARPASGPAAGNQTDIQPGNWRPAPASHDDQPATGT